MQRDLHLMSQEQHDLLIIGGGITGACLSWDAALRGLRVALLDKGDFGSATTSATSKLIHGGLRYLKNREFGLVRESLRERRILSRIAPHAVLPIPFLVPVYRGAANNRFLLMSGMMLYDALSFDKSWGLPQDKRIPRHRFLKPDRVLRDEPNIHPDGLTGAYLYYDCQDVNPERLCLEFIRSAARKGARVANYAEVIDLLRTDDRIEGARVRDRLTGEEHDLRARMTANVTGPWADHILSMCKGVHQRKVRRSKGIHVITRPVSYKHAIALITAKGRHIFVLPWRGQSLLGTTDTEYVGDPNDVSVARSDIESFLADLNECMPAAGLTYNDVRHCYAGLRPIVDQDTQSVYEASRKYEIHDHEAEEGLKGMTTVIGGKYTTSRHLAEKVVTLILKRLQRPPAPCRTHARPVHGGELASLPEAIEEAVRKAPFGLRASTCEHLVRTYGSAYTELFPVLREDPAAGEAICETQEDIVAEVHHAVQREMCVTLSDLLLRRTGIGTLGDPGEACTRRCAGMLAERLGWTAERTEEEIAKFRRYVRIP
ncbi:MAG: glycerol-3-phosphate dehydrogenase/oxidase [bacterium]